MGKKKKSRSIFSTKALFKRLPFLLFVSIFVGIYIANVHFCERKVRAINKVKKELQEQKYRYRSLNAELMYSKKQSEVANGVAAIGLQNDPAAPPILIEVDE